VQDHDWQKIAPDVAKQLLGEPNTQKSDEWRWGTKGSLCLRLSTGTFYDFEEGDGGGVAWLIKHLGKDVEETVKQFGFDRLLPKNNSSLLENKTSQKSSGRSFSKEQMRTLQSQAIVEVQYADNFMVLRFPEGHYIKQKYAPFSLNMDGSWSMKRPEGLLPIYFTEKHKDKPIIINEGEKAMRGCEGIVKGELDACTWHGGVNAWKAADWSSIFGREVWIFPDNDEAGQICAMELYTYFKENKCIVSIIKPPQVFKEKDDLYDAFVRGYFKTSKDFEDYAKSNKKYIPDDGVEFLNYEEMEANDVPPEWLIDTILEKGTVASLYAEPKAGKSFVGISMMLSVATGTPWYEYKTKEGGEGVLYLCGEGEKSIFKRILAWEKHFDTDLKKAPFKVSKRSVGILDDKNYDKLLEKAHEAKNQIGSLGLIIIDTIQRNFGQGDENSTSDMNQFIQRIDRLKFETGACIMLVHHTGHAGTKSNGIRRGRGSSVLPASVDSEFYIEREDELNDSNLLGLDEKVMYVKMSQTLNKEDINMPCINFRMDTILRLGKKKDKKSAVLVKVNENEVPKKNVNHITLKQQQVLDALKHMAETDNPKNPQDVMYMPGGLFGRVLEKDGKTQMKKEAIADRLKELVNKRLVKHIPNQGYQHMEYGGLQSNF
jgi:RecA-family ATPase